LFLNVLFVSIGRSVTDERVKETSVIHRIFGGYFRSQVKCMQPECGHCSNTYDAFLDLSLDVYRLPSVQDALKAFTKVDILEGDNGMASHAIFES
jgi:ubiquitin C-terminal hydrolase